MAESTFFTGPLRTKMSEDLQLTGKAKRTHDGYLREIRKLERQRGRSSVFPNSGSSS